MQIHLSRQPPMFQAIQGGGDNLLVLLATHTNIHHNSRFDATTFCPWGGRGRDKFDNFWCVNYCIGVPAPPGTVSTFEDLCVYRMFSSEVGSQDFSLYIHQLKVKVIVFSVGHFPSVAEQV